MTMSKYYSRMEAHNNALELLVQLLVHSPDYELFEQKECNVFNIFRMFNPTIDGSGDYRGIIASFGYAVDISDKQKEGDDDE